MKPRILLALTGLPLFAGAASAASLEDAERRAEVTLPFAEVKTLLEAAKPPPEPAPPVSAAVTAAKISLSFGAANRSAIAEFEVDIFAKDWQLVPLLRTPFVLKEAKAPGATVLVNDGMLCVLAKEPGHVSVALAFEIPPALAQVGGAPILLKLAAATAGRISISDLPAHSRSILQTESAQSTDGTLPIPIAGGVVTVRLVDDKPVVPTLWASEAQTLVRQTEDGMRIASRIRLTGDSGSGLSAGVELPPSATQIEISGADLSPVHFEIRNGGGKIAELAWETADVLDRDITVAFDLPSPASGESWTLQLPAISQARQAGARTFLIPQAGVAFSGKSVRPVENPASLPAWMAAFPLPGGVWETSATGPITLESRALPRLEADTARIPKAEFRTRIVPDGAQLCEAAIRLQHRGAFRWRFSLPKGSELLSCDVDGRAVNPLLLDGGLLELPLAAASAAVASSEVRLSYTAHGQPFAPVEGKLAISLPATPLFIEELAWVLALPDAYEPTAFEGNVEPIGGSSEITFRKRLVRNEAAAVEIYYRKRDANR